MKRFILFGSLAVVIAAVGFGGGWLAATSRTVPTQPQAELPTPSAAETSLNAHALWGMTLGSKRVYVAEKETETMTVEAIRIEKDRAIYTLKTLDERGNTRFENVFQNAEGVWNLRHTGEREGWLEQPLKLPCNTGDEWDTRAEGWGGIMIRHKCEVIERVTVPAGTFDTFKLKVTAGIVGTERVYWYSQEHGLIQHYIRVSGPGLLAPPARDSLFKLASMK